MAVPLMVYAINTVLPLVQWKWWDPNGSCVLVHCQSELHRNCSNVIRPADLNITNNDTWCDWAPFGEFSLKETQYIKYLNLWGANVPGKAATEQQNSKSQVCLIWSGWLSVSHDVLCIIYLFLIQTRTIIKHFLEQLITPSLWPMPLACFSGMVLFTQLNETSVLLYMLWPWALLSPKQWHLWGAIATALLPHFRDAPQWDLHFALWLGLLPGHPLYLVLRLCPG